MRVTTKKGPKNNDVLVIATALLFLGPFGLLCYIMLCYVMLCYVMPFVVKARCVTTRERACSSV